MAPLWDNPSDTLRRELRQALRGMARSPGFTVIVLVTLALGIGATTAIFTMLDRIALNPLPYTASDRLVWLDVPLPGVNPDFRAGLSVTEFFYLKQNSRTLQNVGVIFPQEVTISGLQSANRVTAAMASASALNVLGVHPVVGRLLTPADNLSGAGHVGVLSYEYWQQRFNRDPRVVGSMINVNTVPTEIIGVMQPEATIPDAGSPQVELWLPMKLDPLGKTRDVHRLPVVARLAPEATIASASVELSVLTKRLRDVFPAAYPPSSTNQAGVITVDAIPLRTHVIGDMAGRLWMLLGGVVFVLLIACANAANIFLVRAEARQHELAIRSALGANRAHLAWHYITESMLLALVAGALALLVATVGLRAIVALAPPDLPRMGTVHVGWTSILFTAVISLILGGVFATPALVGTGKPTSDTIVLRGSGRGLTSSPQQKFARGALVAAQTALALLLMAAAGLMVQSFRNTHNVSPGFDPTGVVTATVSLPHSRYESYEQAEMFDHELITRAAGIPGVQAVGAGTDLPLNGSASGCADIFVEGQLQQPGEEPPCVGMFIVTPGYFHTLGIKLRGREPSWSDVERHSGSIVVTKALADRLWPGQDAIGKGVNGEGSQSPFYHVVGVTDQIRGTAAARPPLEGVFYPMLPIPGTHLSDFPGTMNVVLRSHSMRPAMLTDPLRRILTDMDPDVSLASVQTMDAVVAKSTARLLFTMTLLGTAAVIAFLLSAIGIYGVISYIVSRRAGEIGIRMALGAHSAQVGRLVVWQAVRLASVGILIGIVSSIAMTRVLQSLLFGVSPTDPVTLISVSLIMLITAVVASYVPAQRAMKIDPVEALRAE